MRAPWCSAIASSASSPRTKARRPACQPAARASSAVRRRAAAMPRVGRHARPAGEPTGGESVALPGAARRLDRREHATGAARLLIRSGGEACWGGCPARGPPRVPSARCRDLVATDAGEERATSGPLEERIVQVRVGWRQEPVARDHARWATRPDPVELGPPTESRSQSGSPSSRTTALLPVVLPRGWCILRSPGERNRRGGADVRRGAGGCGEDQ